LGMKDTAHYVPAGKRSRLASVDQPDPKTQRLTIKVEEVAFLDHPPPTSPPAFPHGNYGLVSTVDDILQFARMLLGKGRKDNVRILSHRTASLVTTGSVPADQRAAVAPGFVYDFESQNWGMGLFVVIDPARHDENRSFSSLGSFGYSGGFG